MPSANIVLKTINSENILVWADDLANVKAAFADKFTTFTRNGLSIPFGEVKAGDPIVISQSPVGLIQSAQSDM
jgi:hypothetical protein